MLKLYSYDRSPYGWKVRVVLSEKKIPYEMIAPPQNKDQDPDFARLTPLRLTPVLVLEDGRTVYESTVINEYLEEAYPNPPMLPRDPYERARVRVLEDISDQYLHEQIWNVMDSQYEYSPPFLIRKKADQVNHTLLEESRKKVHEHLAHLEKELKGRTWFGGSLFSLADATLAAPLTATLRLLGILPDAKYPNIATWAGRITERPSYRASAPKESMKIKEE